MRIAVTALSGLVLLLAGVIAGQNLERSRRAEPPPTAGADPANAAAPVQPPRSATEYWITRPERDATRTGFSAWAVLRPGGNLVVERCRAPDRATRTPGQDPYPIPECEELVDGTIAVLGDDHLVVATPQGRRTLRYALARSGGIESLRLDTGEEVELVPGSRNDLFQRLMRLQ